MRIRSIPIWFTAIIVMFACCGCSSEPKLTPRPPKPPSVSVLRNISHLGGTHYRMAVQGKAWYQTFGTELLVLDPVTALELKRIPFGKDGEIGPATDLAIAGRRMYVVIEDDEVIELSLTVPQMPAIKQYMSAEELGIRPRRLSVVDGQCYASGLGGVVRLSDRTRIMSTPPNEDVGRVAMGAQGLVTTIGRQVHRVSDDKFVGSATEVQMLPSDINAPADATMIFVRQSDQGALIGLMSPEVREFGKKTTVAVGGVGAGGGLVRTVRAAKDKLWVVSDSGVTAFKVSPDSLDLDLQIDVLGALDAAPLDENHIAIAGAFGRAIYRINADEKGPGGVFLGSHREPAGLLRAVSDSQHILAGGELGSWMYLINSRVELTTRTFENVPPPPSKQAAIVNAQARISADGKSILITGAAGQSTYAEPDGCVMSCIAAIDGEFWIGHARGITVLEERSQPPVAGGHAPDPNHLPPASEFHPASSLRLEGPVLYIYPLMVGGGASYVSENGGFGVAKFVDEPIGH